MKQPRIQRISRIAAFFLILHGLGHLALAMSGVVIRIGDWEVPRWTGLIGTFVAWLLAVALIRAARFEDSSCRCA